MTERKSSCSFPATAEGADFLPQDAVPLVVRERRGPDWIADVVGGQGGGRGGLVAEDRVTIGLDQVCVVVVLSGHDAPSESLDRALGQVALLLRRFHRDNDDGSKRQHRYVLLRTQMNTH